MEKQKTYIAIDLKSFYASVECVDRALDPLTTNLLVADVSKTEKTICLAVTPSLKAHGISGRARLFEAVQQVNIVNAQRKARLRGKEFTGSSYDDTAEDIAKKEADEDREKRMQRAMLDIKTRFGPNAVMKGTSYLDAATGIERNEPIGGHKA